MASGVSRHLFVYYYSVLVVLLNAAVKISSFPRPTPQLPLLRTYSFSPSPRTTIHSPHVTVCFAGENDTNTKLSDSVASESSKRQMLKFKMRYQTLVFFWAELIRDGRRSNFKGGDAT